ncbi:MAG: hypothetical protein IMZ62_15835 [Chloroflexi bacterium]|nr:hypothetical protein [Chloroflexota bacterium]
MMMKPTEALICIANEGVKGDESSKWLNEILALLRAVEKADPDQLFDEYMNNHGQNTLPILNAALTLKGK